MKIKDFRCHMCGQMFFGNAKMQLTLIGFNWNPAAFDSPGYLYDLCPDCSNVFCKKWIEGRDDRRNEVEKQNAETWQARLLADPTGSRARSGSVRISEAQEIAREWSRWNYRKEDQKKPWRT